MTEQLCNIIEFIVCDFIGHVQVSQRTARISRNLNVLCVCVFVCSYWDGKVSNEWETQRHRKRNVNGVCSHWRDTFHIDIEHGYLYGETESCISTHLSEDHYAMIHGGNIFRRHRSIDAIYLLWILYKFVSEILKLDGIRLGRFFFSLVEKTFTSWSAAFIHCYMLFISHFCFDFYASIK